MWTTLAIVAAVIAAIFLARWFIFMIIRNERETACYLMHQDGLQCGCKGCWCAEGVKRIMRS